MAAPLNTNPPSDNNRGLLIAVIAVGAAFLLALGLLIGLLVSRSSSDVDTTAPTTVRPAPTTSRSSSTSTSTSTSTTSTTSSSTSTTSSTTSTTAAPTTSAPASGLSQVCTADSMGVRVRYPTGWHTSSGFGTDCLLFDPEPFVVIPDSESPVTAVHLAVRDSDLATALAEETNPDVVAVESQVPMTLGGRDAMCVTMTSTGVGLLEAGTRMYDCLVDFGGRTLVVGSHRPPGAPAVDYDPVVRDMASAAAPL